MTDEPTTATPPVPGEAEATTKGTTMQLALLNLNTAGVEIRSKMTTTGPKTYAVAGWCEWTPYDLTLATENVHRPDGVFGMALALIAASLPVQEKWVTKVKHPISFGAPNSKPLRTMHYELRRKP
jgi:hypothetical protein